MAVKVYRVRDLPEGMTVLVCTKCGRRGQYLRETFIARCGPDMALPDARHEMAQCDRRDNMSDYCGVTYETPLER